MMPFIDKESQNIFVLNNTKIYHLVELTKMCLDVDIFLVYLLLYLYNYNSIKILFVVLKYYIKKN